MYLPERRTRLAARRPFVTRRVHLSRELSVSLTDARAQPPYLDPAVGPHGECFTNETPLLWFNEATLGDQPENAWKAYDADTNRRLAEAYGVLSVTPILDQLSKNCVGVLAVHVEPEPSVALQALGVLQQGEGRRRLKNACVELNGLLVR